MAVMKSAKAIFQAPPWWPSSWSSWPRRTMMISCVCSSPCSCSAHSRISDRAVDHSDKPRLEQVSVDRDGEIEAVAPRRNSRWPRVSPSAAAQRLEQRLRPADPRCGSARASASAADRPRRGCRDRRASACSRSSNGPRMRADGGRRPGDRCASSSARRSRDRLRRRSRRSVAAQRRRARLRGARAARPVRPRARGAEAGARAPASAFADRGGDDLARRRPARRGGAGSTARRIGAGRRSRPASRPRCRNPAGRRRAQAPSSAAASWCGPFAQDLRACAPH